MKRYFDFVAQLLPLPCSRRNHSLLEKLSQNIYKSIKEHYFCLFLTDVNFFLYSHSSNLDFVI